MGAEAPNPGEPTRRVGVGVAGQPRHQAHGGGAGHDQQHRPARGDGGALHVAADLGEVPEPGQVDGGVGEDGERRQHQHLGQRGAGVPPGGPRLDEGPRADAHEQQGGVGAGQEGQAQERAGEQAGELRATEHRAVLAVDPVEQQHGDQHDRRGLQPVHDHPEDEGVDPHHRQDAGGHDGDDAGGAPEPPAGDPGHHPQRGDPHRELQHQQGPDRGHPVESHEVRRQRQAQPERVVAVGGVDRVERRALAVHQVPGDLRVVEGVVEGEGEGDALPQDDQREPHEADEPGRSSQDAEGLGLVDHAVESRSRMLGVGRPLDQRHDLPSARDAASGARRAVRPTRPRRVARRSCRVTSSRRRTPHPRRGARSSRACPTRCGAACRR